jgi:hypothetical protein
MIVNGTSFVGNCFFNLIAESLLPTCWIEKLVKVLLEFCTLYNIISVPNIFFL